MRWWVLLCCAGSLCAGEIEGVRRVRAHLLIQDRGSAVEEAEALYRAAPESKEVLSALLEALAAAGSEERALAVWREATARDPAVTQDRHLVEELAWGVLRRGMESTQMSVRVAGLIGAYLTHDVRAVPLIWQSLRDTNAVIRMVAIQMAASYGDAILKEEVARLFREEKVWAVRLEALRALGPMRIVGLAPQLRLLLGSERHLLEERAAAIESLVEMTDAVSSEELRALCRSNRAGLRQLGAHLAAHFGEGREEVQRLVQDAHPDVRIAALNALALCGWEGWEGSLEDAEPSVAITAAYVALQRKGERGEAVLRLWLKSELPEVRRLAAAAVAAAGPYGVELGVEMLDHADPWVRVNVARGLMGQKVERGRCADIFFEQLEGEPRMWMWERGPNPLFSAIGPSHVRYQELVPQYPEAVDQLTRLELLGMLAVVEDPRALAAVKGFLQRRNWGVTGLAATTLLEEGDEGALDVVRGLASDPDPNVALQASLVLAFLARDEQALPALYRAYAGADHMKKLQILEALGRIGDVGSIPFLLHALEEPFPILRVAAAAALIEGVNG